MKTILNGKLNHAEILALTEDEFLCYLKSIYIEIEYTTRNEVNPNRLAMLQEHIEYITEVR